MQKNTKNHT